MFPSSFRMLWCSRILLALVMAGAEAWAGGLQDLDSVKVAKKVLPCVVRICIPRNDGVFTLGTGSIIHKSGLILTNRHVVEGRDPLLVSLYDPVTEEGKEEWKKATVLFQSGPSEDIALIKIETDPTLPEIELGRSAD